MATCSSCQSEIPVNSRFCLTCGSAVNGVPMATVATIAMVSHPSARPFTVVPSGFDEGRFLPGTLISERYRVISRLGRGGMGEVYRANDLRLGQTVALKFLPEAMVHDPGMLARFHNEVRVARQVTHPNVCRVYDIGEMDGQPFISMEFVDGEDLATLLRRIGRLPQDKAIEMARRLCAGLAAAHTQGVLHRDLKPANIMIDGRGQVIVTDFGLAGLTEQLQGAEVRNGTPAYMAPEQLTGREVSFQSDIYALGLVLYEMFTGQPAHKATTLAEMVKIREESQTPSLTTLIHDIDPAVERIVLKCLEPDPRNRPASALAVAAALPGGDPLAAALAAGETPSPEMVAQAGTVEGIQPRYAIAGFVAVVIGLLGVLAMVSYLALTSKVNLEMPPEALAIKARSLIREFGYTDPVMDRHYGLSPNSDYILYLKDREHSWNRWAALANGQPPMIQFWYRESPRHLTTLDNYGTVTSTVPAMAVSGMTYIVLDPQGRLVGFRAVPPELDKQPNAQPSLDDKALFAAAGIDPSRFQPAEPQWAPLAMADKRSAWTGTLPDWPGLATRIEAASWHGKPIYFQVIGPWTKAHRMDAESKSAGQLAGIAEIIVFLVIYLVAAFMARQNVRLGRGDRNGAIRLGLFACVASFTAWMFSAHHALTTDEFSLLFLGVGNALWAGAQLWLAYLALEPHVRRRWPQTLLGWSRAIAGRFSDPMVGRDVLIGVLIGVLWALLFRSMNLYMSRLGDAPSTENWLDGMIGFRHLAAGVAGHIVSALSASLIFFLLIFLLRVVLRKQWIAAAAFVAIFVLTKAVFQPHPEVGVPVMALVFGLVVVTLMRFGLIALATSIFVTDMQSPFVWTFDFSAWYGTASLMVLLMICALAAYGARTAALRT